MIVEEKLIGSIILTPEYQKNITSYPNIFFEKKALFETIRQLSIDDIDLTPENITAKSSGIGIDYIMELYENAYSEDYAFQKAFDKQLQSYIAYSVDMVQQKQRSGQFNSYQDYTMALDECNIDMQYGAANTKTIEEVYTNIMEKKPNDRYMTGIRRIDNYGGLPKSSYIIIAARPGEGKTSLMVQMMANDMKESYKIGLISLEMPADDIFQKLIANKTNINENNIDIKNLTAVEEAKIAQYMDSTKDYPIEINDDPDIDIDSICRLITRWKKDKHIDKVYIDYLQFIGSHHKQTDFERLNYITDKLAKLKRRLAMNIIVLAQINRKVDEGKAPRRPRVSDLKGSGKIEQDADVIFLLNEVEKIDKCTATTEIIIGKGRKMPTGFIRTIWAKDKSKFTEV